MSYTKLTDFAAKDALLSGNPSKLLRGTEIGAEFDAIESAMTAAEAVNITAPIIAASTSKTTPVNADVLPILDSAAANILKKVTWANIKATLKTYFDTLYAAVGSFAASGANSDITSLTGLTTPLSQRFVALSSGTGYSSNTTLTNSAYGQFIYLWGTMTLTLPVATVDNIGKTISLHCYTTGAITIATQSGQSIFAQGGSIGTTYPIMSAGDSLTLVNYNGTSWMAVSGSGGIGYGQTRQNLNGSRSLSTTYYNTTGKPIIVEVASPTATITVTVGGVSTAGSPYTSTFIVPQGASYSVAATAGLVAWNETR